LTGSNNSFGDAVSASGGQIDIASSNDLKLGQIRASGSFTASAAGNITKTLGSTIAASGGATLTPDSDGDGSGRVQQEQAPSSGGGGVGAATGSLNAQNAAVIITIPTEKIATISSAVQTVSNTPASVVISTTGSSINYMSTPFSNPADAVYSSTGSTKVEQGPSTIALVTVPSVDNYSWAPYTVRYRSGNCLSLTRYF